MSGPLANIRQERFAQALAKGLPASRAYVEAGYKPCDAHASRLAGIGKVSARVSILKQRAATRTEVTVASITERLLAIADKAEAKEYGASGLAVSRASLMDVAKLNGLIIDQVETTQRLAPEDRARRLIELRAERASLTRGG